MNKPTIATVKSFIRNNTDKLLIQVAASFDGMTDAVEYHKEKTFVPIQKAENVLPSYNMGLRGVWFTLGKNWVQPIETATHKGFEVSNSCGKWLVAIAK